MRQSKVKVRFYEAQFFSHGTLLNFQMHCNDTVKELDQNKLLETGIDGPNANLKLFKFIQQYRKGNEKHQLIDIESFELHAICHTIVCIGVSTPLKNIPPLFLAKPPLKSANCPSSSFLDNSPLYIGFS